MTNREIHIALIKPNAEIVVLPLDSERKKKLCLKATGIYAEKKTNKTITVVESTDARIQNGSVILFVDGIYSDDLDISKISEMLLFPKCTITYEIDVIHRCLEAHSIKY